MTTVLSFGSLAERALSSAQALSLSARVQHRVRIAIARTVVELRFSDTRAMRILEHRYGDMLETRSNIEPLFTLTVVHSEEGIFLWADPADAKWYPLAVASSDAIAFLADAVLGHEFFRRHGAMSLHAAVLETNGRIFALVGKSTIGKTTTSIACASLGMRFGSDERCVLSNRTLFPFPRALTLRPGGRRLLSANSDIGGKLKRTLQLMPHDGEVSVRPSRCFEHLLTEPGSLHAVFLLNALGDEPLIEPVATVQTLPSLMQAAMMREIGLDRPARLLHELAGVSTYNLRLGSPSATARAIRTWLQ